MSLVTAAGALDNLEPEAALEALICAPLVPAEVSIRRVALSLWKSLISSPSAASLGSLQHTYQVSNTLDLLFSAANDGKLIWDVYHELAVLEKELGPRIAGAIVATLFWNRVLEAPDELFIAVLELFFRSQNMVHFDAAWHQFLQQDTGYVPDYRRFHLYIQSLLDRGRSDLHDNIECCLRDTGRTDLEPLMTVYLALLQQADLETIFNQARELKDSRHRAAVENYLLETVHDDNCAIEATKKIQNNRDEQLFLNNQNANIAEYEAAKPELNSKPTWIQIEPTTLCNIHCMMCREQSDNKNLGDLADPELFSHIYNSGWLQYIELLELNGWGETFLHPQITWFLEKCAQFKQLQIQITTNGLLIDKSNHLELLCKLQRINLVFSIDSAKKANYEKIRQGGSWELLVSNIEALNNLVDRTQSNLTKEVAYLVTLLDIEGLKSMVDFAANYGFDVLEFTRIHDCPELEVPDSIAFPAMEAAVDYAVTKGISCISYASNEKIADVYKETGDERIWRCKRPWNHMMILMDGSVVPCCFLAAPQCNATMGNLGESTLSTIWNSEKYMRLRLSAFSGYPEFCDVGINGCKAKTNFFPNVDLGVN